MNINDIPIYNGSVNFITSQNLITTEKCFSLYDFYLSQIFQMRIVIIILMFGFIIIYYKKQIRNYFGFD